MGWSRILYLFVYVLFLPHRIPRCTIGAELPVMNVSTKANFSVHCSIPVPARNLDASCFCVELQFLYMVNVKVAMHRRRHQRPRPEADKSRNARHW